MYLDLFRVVLTTVRSTLGMGHWKIGIDYLLASTNVE